jgi:pyrroloquinoline-quinone synthase
VKDATLLARLPTAELRREWRRRLVDHDGDGLVPGGWLAGLNWQRVGLDPKLVESAHAILPATRFAVDAYVHFVRDRSMLEAIASSLTEMFSPTIIAERVGDACQL